MVVRCVPDGHLFESPAHDFFAHFLPSLGSIRYGDAVPLGVPALFLNQEIVDIAFAGPTLFQVIRGPRERVFYPLFANTQLPIHKRVPLAVSIRAECRFVKLAIGLPLTL